MTVKTRFAPSPTGFLHIGGARTALFNWLYAKHHGGTFHLRIEDTDRKRSTPQAVQAILDGMQWLGLNWDDDEIYQFSRIERHKQIAQELIDNGKAYRCYCTKEELQAMRDKAQQEKRSFKYDGTWRNRSEQDYPKNSEFVIRLKAPQTGQTIINDLVQGKITVPNQDQDDMVLLRADGTPTYMLAVVVDDHDMQITHIIRGDDHLTNATRQQLIYDAMGWTAPQFAHIPLIYGPDGTKMSKRHGALGVDSYKDMGYLPEAMLNYLLRLGWSHGDDEIINLEQAIKWFDTDHIGKSPSRFDFTKLDSINSHYIHQTDNLKLLELITPSIEEKLQKSIPEQNKKWLESGLEDLKQRVKNLKELSENSLFYIDQSLIELTDKAKKSLNAESTEILTDLITELNTIDLWQHENIENTIRQFANNKDLGLGKIMMPLRATITNSHNSPSMFNIMQILGKQETINRIKNTTQHTA